MIEFFEIVASSESQQEDAGWWFCFALNGVDLGPAHGPFPSEEAARREASGLWIN